jgi:hypothetical protein
MSWKMQRATGVRDKWLGWLGGHFSKIDPSLILVLLTFFLFHARIVKWRRTTSPDVPSPKNIFSVVIQLRTQVQLADLESTRFQRLKLSVAYIHRHSLYKRAWEVVFLACVIECIHSKIYGKAWYFYTWCNDDLKNAWLKSSGYSFRSLILFIVFQNMVWKLR